MIRIFDIENSFSKKIWVALQLLGKLEICNFFCCYSITVSWDIRNIWIIELYYNVNFNVLYRHNDNKYQLFGILWIHQSFLIHRLALVIQNCTLWCHVLPVIVNREYIHAKEARNIIWINSIVASLMMPDLACLWNLNRNICLVSKAD